ncbi:PIN domain-containing protein [Thermosynechococcaceae cyanobacterium BACA0444]|uniref:PIN domain-containing protein n=1 Tax=Pseudocalidococcus azoricus BACA0444 TaxID=2918990 RepID=A0AAE4FS73_9CYAN|nr:PIN domain-containing protein [Pseudocalidococcus azoricus BACA0444]
MRLLLDTHIWLWYSLGETQLSQNLREIIASKTTELWLSPISIWEVLLLVEKGRISLQVKTTDWIGQSLEALEICEATLNHQIAILSRQIGLPHQDPADRFIVASALYYGLQLATVDSQLTGLAGLPTLS